MKVEQFHVKNQFFITDDEENRFFQSYNSIIVKREATTGKIFLDTKYWDYSKTTGKYRNLFLMETKAETQAKIDNGIYTLTDLNP